MIFEVSCSCLEIYNERIADLLASGGALSASNDADSAPSTPRGSFTGGYGPGECLCVPGWPQLSNVCMSTAGSSCLQPAVSIPPCVDCTYCPARACFFAPCRSTPKGSRVRSAASQQSSAALEVREVLGGGCEVKGLSQHAALNGAPVVLYVSQLSVSQTSLARTYPNAQDVHTDPSTSSLDQRSICCESV